MSPAPKTRREQLIAAGEWLASQRDGRGLSQRELGRLIGKSYQSVSGYERGLSAPDDDTCEELARILVLPTAEVRRRFGKFVSPDMATDPPPAASVLDAILADPDLRPDFKEHISNQYKILREASLVTRVAPGPTPESLAAELQAQVEAEQESPDRHRRAADHG